MLKFYYKPTCSTCQVAQSILEEHSGEEIEFIEYLNDTPSPKDLKEILQMSGLKAEDIIRKKEPLYQEKYLDKVLTEEEWLKVLSENPILIERPIVVKDGKAILGRPPEKIIDLFKNNND